VGERKYTFVTVAHEEDWSVLGLQARSLHLYLPEDLVAEILVVDNSSAGAPAEFLEALLRDYGRLAARVRILSAQEVGDIPDGTEGWFSQQILKLMVSNEIATDRYIALDAKNHLVFPLRRSFLEIGDKIPSWLTNYEKHTLRPYLEKSLRYFGVNPHDHVRAFLPAITPYTLPTAIVRDLIRVVVQREGKPFPAAFLEQRFSEFFLFAAFLRVLEKTEEIYDFSGIPCSTIWDENAIRGARNLMHHIRRAQKNALPFFAVHRRAVPWLDDKSRRTIAEFWHQRGLFPSVADGVDWLTAAASRSPRHPGAERFYLRWKSRFSGLNARVRRRYAKIRA
jgi:Family of unknown function (DUF6492)